MGERIQIRAVVPTSLNETHREKYPGVNVSERVTRAMRADLAASSPDLAEAAIRDYTLVRVLLESISHLTAAADGTRGPAAKRGLKLLVDASKQLVDANLEDITAAMVMINEALALSDKMLESAHRVSKLLDLGEWRRTVGDVPPDDELQHQPDAAA